MKKFLLPIVLCLLAAPKTWAEDAFVKDRHGCQLLQSADEASRQTYEWKGKCKAGKTEGRGTLLVFEQGKLAEKETATFQNGLREGHARTIYVAGQELIDSESNYAHGKRNGKSVSRHRSGDKIEQNFVEGEATNDFVFSNKKGDRFEGEMLSDTSSRGKWVYANGDEYQGVMTYGTRNGPGTYGKKGANPQTGDFILDEFVDIGDETASRLMPVKFGLELGMTRAQVEAVSGEMVASPDSVLRNAYDLQHFPRENFAAPNMVISHRSVYFDDEGRLWRILAKIQPNGDSYFGGEVMQAYGAIGKWLSLHYDLDRIVEPYPHYQEDIDSCRDVAAWEKDNPKSFNLARQSAPAMPRIQRVMFDIGCGAIAHWERAYLSRDGKERYTVVIRDGNLYATPVVYSAAIAGETQMARKMTKAATPGK